ncbi:MAG: DUF3347 domain-containing protein [Pedobacter sp.]|nr:MAG: DUF3347 domain-containing protein [Pedobacter sp.]
MKKIFGIAILASLLACNQAEKKSSEVTDAVQKDAKASSTKIEIKDEKKFEILNQYEDLKNALVASDATKAQKSASVLGKSLANYEGCEPTAEIAAKIASNNDLVAQRKNFTVLSADVIALFKTTEIESGILYVQHCPMANKGDGGDWLSTEKEIRNPYFGDEMLECGRVAEEIKGK